MGPRGTGQQVSKSLMLAITCPPNPIARTWAAVLPEHFKATCPVKSRAACVKRQQRSLTITAPTFSRVFFRLAVLFQELRHFLAPLELLAFCLFRRIAKDTPPLLNTLQPQHLTIQSQLTNKITIGRTASQWLGRLQPSPYPHSSPDRRYYRGTRFNFMQVAMSIASIA